MGKGSGIGELGEEFSEEVIVKLANNLIKNVCVPGVHGSVAVLSKMSWVAPGGSGGSLQPLY
jgi:hypothetical protein